MRRTRWAVFTRMNDLIEAYPRREAAPEEREWSVRVTPPADPSPFLDGGRREAAPFTDPDGRPQERTR
jgi:hypothetical protein